MEMWFMTLVFFAVLMLFLGMGYPIAFSMGSIVAVVILFVFDSELLFQLAQIAMQLGTSNLLVVASLFILMSEFILCSGVSSEAFVAAQRWLGWVPGGLAVASIVACTGFAAVCGSSPVTAATVGSVAIKGMVEHGYRPSMAAGVVAAAGTIGIMIPPSLCMIIYGIMTGVSIGKLFIAGVIPGIIVAIVLAAAVMIRAKMHPEMAPPVPEQFSWKERFSSLILVGPILALSILVLGAIYGGFATPTEAGAVGATGAFAIMIIKKRGNLKDILPATVRAACVTSAIMWLLIGGTSVAFIVSYADIPNNLLNFMLSLGLNNWWIIIMINIFLIILGCFLDPMGIMVLTLPFLFPLILSLGFDPVWFGVIMTLNVEVGMVTPPVGMNLFVIKAVVPDLPLIQIVKGVIPYVFCLFFCLGLFLIFPEIVLWLPNIMQ